ncbi:MAG: hypothetical protein FJZ97_10135 [Chloroflexi bacterium]|nr:hypothetical protein [Chloroflexota bacterium]
MTGKETPRNVWSRRRGYAGFRVDNPREAAERVSALFTQGGDDYVVIRADVVSGCDVNLIVPIDAAEEVWSNALALVERAVGQPAARVCIVTSYLPAVPQQAHCFVTEDEHRQFPLHEYSPPGRHPKSPGANPWG